MNNKELIKNIKQGKIFIYPTDTVYGLGCDAGNVESVERIKEIKKREVGKPLSVIAPSLKWINDNLVVDVDLDKYLPGPYTVVLKKKDEEFLSHVSSGDSLGIRIPRNKLTKIIQKSEVPFITTSVNLSGESPVKSVDEVPDEIKDRVEVIINRGPLTGNPSTLVINGGEVGR